MADMQIPYCTPCLGILPPATPRQPPLGWLHETKQLSPYHRTLSPTTLPAVAFGHPIHFRIYEKLNVFPQRQQLRSQRAKHRL